MTEETRMRGGRGLAEALEEDLEQWSARTGIVVEIWALPKTPVPPRVTRAALAVFDEALANVEQHSGARAVSIAVTAAASGLRVTISDDGVGRAEPMSGRGVSAMRAAFAELGGSLTVTTAFGAGTTVTGVVPTAE